MRRVNLSPPVVRNFFSRACSVLIIQSNCRGKSNCLAFQTVKLIFGSNVWSRNAIWEIVRTCSKSTDVVFVTCVVNEKFRRKCRLFRDVSRTSGTPSRTACRLVRRVAQRAQMCSQWIVSFFIYMMFDFNSPRSWHFRILNQTAQFHKWINDSCI